MKLTQVYRYGLLSPTLEADRVNEQISLAHRYRNKLVEIERTRREAIQSSLDCEAVRLIDKKLAELPKADGLSADELAKVKATRKKLWKERKAIPEVVQAAEAAKKAKKAAVREARKTSGVYWGTYLIVEQAAETAAGGIETPKFKRWEGTGTVAIQLQRGLTLDKFLAGADSRAQLSLTPIKVPKRSGKPLPRLKLRVGSDDRGPIWAEWPLIYHRPLPNGTVKWIKVIREKTASREWWTAHIVIEHEKESSAAGQGLTCALDLRWRHDEVNGQPTQRAGEWTNGKQGGVIILDPSVVGALRKADDLRSIRDNDQNKMHAKVLEWVKARELPEAHAERVDHIAQWKSPARFASLAIWWRTNRLDGDQEFLNLLEAWRKRDKHLWLWEAHARSRALLRRKDQYRIEASRLVKEHDQLVVEAITLNKLALVPEDDDAGQKKARSQRFDTAPSALRMAFLNAFQREGKPIFTVKPGPLRTVWQAWCEQHGVEKKAKPARSKRFNRMRKIKDDAEVAKA